MAEFDHLSEKRDQRGEVQGDHVPAEATPHTPVSYHRPRLLLPLH